MNEFIKLGLSEETLETLTNKGYLKPTEIQEKCIPLLLDNKFDVIGQAQTGTGKTASFALPIIELLDVKQKHIQAIVLCPIRELAIQVAAEIKSLSSHKNIKVMAAYGGASIRDQIKELKSGVHIVVGTPGRVMDLMRQRKMDLSNLYFAVLDEADEMLNMGFVDDIKQILSETNSDKRMLFFSATMPKEILKIAKKFMREFKTIQVAKSDSNLLRIDQHYYSIKAHDRYQALKRILAINGDFYGIIFCRTKSEVDTVAKKLSGEGFKAAAIHGDISQNVRENIMGQFKKKRVTILIATDVAARGIHVNDLTHVINYSLPESPEVYTHRIGRTGRAGKKGTAITFLIPSERRKFGFFESKLNHQLKKSELPGVSEVIEIKKGQIKDVIKNISEKGDLKQYEQLVKDMLVGSTPHKILAAMLKYAFENELNADKFKEIEVVNESRRDRASSRDERPRRRDSGRSYGRRDSGRSSGRRDSGRNSGRRDAGRGSNRRSSRGDDSGSGKKKNFKKSFGKRRSGDRDDNKSGRKFKKPIPGRDKKGGRSSGGSRFKRR